MITRIKHILKDFFVNLYLKYRYYYIKKYRQKLLSNISEVEKDGKVITFNDDFNEKSWSLNGDTKWRVGEGWGMFHPEKPNVYYGEPEQVGSTLAKFTCKYNPKTF